MIGQNVDTELIPFTRQAVLPNSSKYQFGFKKRVSCINVVGVLTEALMEAKNIKSPIYVCYMDTSKAFDMVDHQGLLLGLLCASTHKVSVDQSDTCIRAPTSTSGLM